MSSTEVNEINEELQKYLDNFAHEDYDEYLDNFKKTLEDRKKCQKSKKCAFDFTVNQSNIIKKKGDQVVYNISLPKYTHTESRLKEIRTNMNMLDREIRYLQNILSLESDKKLIEEYKIYRKDFKELEKEEKMLVDYGAKVNKDEEIEQRKMELNLNLRKLRSEKLVLYQQIQIMNSDKKKPNFSSAKYHAKIKEYLDNQEIEMIKLELQNLEKYYLKTDKLFFNTQRNQELGRINYLIEKMPGIKKKTTKKITKSVKK